MNSIPQIGQDLFILYIEVAAWILFIGCLIPGISFFVRRTVRIRRHNRKVRARRERFYNGTR